MAQMAIDSASLAMPTLFQTGVLFALEVSYLFICDQHNWHLLQAVVTRDFVQCTEGLGEARHVARVDHEHKHTRILHKVVPVLTHGLGTAN